MASQEAIKELGNNGGGFFNANSAHPFENPNPFTNLLRDLPAPADPVQPAAHVRQDGRRQPAGLRAARRDGDHLGRRGRRASPSSRPTWHRGTRRRSSRHGAMEGKEARFGTPACSLFAASTTVTSTGAVNCFHDSLHAVRRRRSRCSTWCWARSRPAASGPGCTASWCWPSSRCSSAGLMVGRTPEYLGKKIRPAEMKYAALYFLHPAGAHPDRGRRCRSALKARPGIDLQPGPARADRGACTRSPRWPTTTGPRSPASARQPPGTTRSPAAS